MERVQRAYEYRIFPDREQEEFFLKTLGLCRLFWNLNLAQKNEDYSNKLLTYHQCFSKHKPEALEWIRDINVTALNNEYMHIQNAFNNFFHSVKKQRKGKFVKPPKFKSKKNPKDSFTLGPPKFKDGRLWISSKIAPLSGSYYCQFCEGKIKNCTVKRTSTGKWFVKILVEKRPEEKCKNGKFIGIDWNCRDDSFITMSDGTKIKCPRFLRRRESHLAHCQRTMSRRYKIGAEKQSHRYERAKLRVALLHEHVAWTRKDWLHKLSRELANKYEYVVVEDINLQVMASKLHHGRAVGDQGFGMLREFIAYKTNLVKVPAPFTSMTCHVCGQVNKNLTLSDREWDCPRCGSHLDRDVNAALNVVGRGISRICNARGGPSSSVKREDLKTSTEAGLDLAS
jgi:putative transposase